MAANPNFIAAVLETYHGLLPTYKAMLVDPEYVADPFNETGTELAATHEIAGVARIDLPDVDIVTDETECRLTCGNLTFDGLDGTTDVGGVVIYVDGGGTEGANTIASYDLDDGPFTPPAGPLNYLVDDGFVVLSV